LINYDSPTLDWDLADMDKMQLIGEIMRMHKELVELRNFRDDAFEAHSNIDLDIEFVKREKRRKAQWRCPLNYPGCHENCGSYGCGN
jgi:hypothetical protein